jgi:hypothetical protein
MGDAHMKTSTKWVGGAILMGFMTTNYVIAYSERRGDIFDLVATLIFGFLAIVCCVKMAESQEVEKRGKGPYECPFCNDVQIEYKDFCKDCGEYIGTGWSESTTIRQCPFCKAIQPGDKDYCLNCGKHKVTGESETETINNP